MIDWNDEAVRETARFIVDASHDLLGMAAQFAPGHEDDFLLAMADAMECSTDGCDCGGELPGCWPKPFDRQCDYHRHCLCGGHYHKQGLVLRYA